MSTKLFHKSTRMPYSSFVKFSWLQKSYDKKTLWKSGFAFLPYHYHGNCYIFPWWKYWSLDLELLFALYFSVQFFPLVNSWSIHIDYNHGLACIQSFQTFQSLQALTSLISIFTFLLVLFDVFQLTFCYDLSLKKIILLAESFLSLVICSEC